MHLNGISGQSLFVNITERKKSCTVLSCTVDQWAARSCVYCEVFLVRCFWPIYPWGHVLCPRHTGNVVIIVISTSRDAILTLELRSRANIGVALGWYPAYIWHWLSLQHVRVRFVVMCCCSHRLGVYGTVGSLQCCRRQLKLQWLLAEQHLSGQHGHAQ